jgi:hypothetical protein
MGVELGWTVGMAGVVDGVTMLVTVAVRVADSIAGWPFLEAAELYPILPDKRFRSG